MSKDRVSLADAIRGAVSDLDTAQREQIEYIEEPRISGDDDNFYSIDGIEELAANIELVGLQQPLRVRPDPDAEGGYIVVSGHRRLTAIRTICKVDEPEKWKTVPCIVERGELSPAMRELRLIMANSDTRRMSSADTAQQVERVRELLYQLQEEGVDFPGRMRDHVAEACKISKTKIATLDVISKGLSKSNKIQQSWKNGNLSESTAYELAKLPRELQDEIVEIFKNRKGWHGGDLRYLYGANVKKIAEEIAKLEAFRCDVDENPCQNCATMKRQHMIAVYLDSAHSYCSCAEKCCEDCDLLVSCKEVCPHLKAHQDKLKSDKKAAAKREKELQAEKDAPKIKAIQELWNRFGQARNAADVSVEDAYKAMDVYYTRSDEQETIQKECLEGKFTPETKLPYGYGVGLHEIKRYVQIADKFGVSLDYLFCRTDEPKMASSAAAAVSESDTKPTWRLGNPLKKGAYYAKFDVAGKPCRIAEWSGWDWRFQGGMTIQAECVGWYPLPEE